jgi:hypothetical protein
MGHAAVSEAGVQGVDVDCEVIEATGCQPLVGSRRSQSPESLAFDR